MWFLDTYLDLGPVKNAKSKPKSMFPIAWRFCSCLHAVSGDFSTFSCSSLTTWTWPKICSGCLVLGWFDWCLRLLLGGLISNTTTSSEEVRTSRLQVKTTWNKRVIAAQEKIMTSRWNEHARKWSCWLLACIELRGPCSGHVRALQKSDSEILQLMQLLQLALNLLECGSHPQPSHFVGLHISWFQDLRRFRSTEVGVSNRLPFVAQVQGLWEPNMFKQCNFMFAASGIWGLRALCRPRSKAIVSIKAWNSEVLTCDFLACRVNCTDGCLWRNPRARPSFVWTTWCNCMAQVTGTEGEEIASWSWAWRNSSEVIIAVIWGHRKLANGSAELIRFDLWPDPWLDWSFAIVWWCQAKLLTPVRLKRCRNFDP